MEGTLTCYEILDIADYIADQYALKKVNPLRFRKRYDRDIPIPLITSNENGSLWADREYVAFALNGQPTQYAFVTRWHILEERASYKALTLCRENPVKLPGDVRVAFRTALRGMVTTNKDYHIFEGNEALVH